MLAFQHSGFPARKWCFYPILDVPGVFLTSQLEEIFVTFFTVFLWVILFHHLTTRPKFFCLFICFLLCQDARTIKEKTQKLSFLQSENLRKAREKASLQNRRIAVNRGIEKRNEAEVQANFRDNLSGPRLTPNDLATQRQLEADLNDETDLAAPLTSPPQPALREPEPKQTLLSKYIFRCCGQNERPFSAQSLHCPETVLEEVSLQLFICVSQICVLCCWRKFRFYFVLLKFAFCVLVKFQFFVFFADC